MKRIIACLLLLVLTACCAAKSNAVETKPQPAPAVRAFNTVYCWSGHAFYRTPDESEYTGRIRYIVPQTARPTQNNEANIPCQDAPFVLLDDGIALFVNGEWQLFKPES